MPGTRQYVTVMHCVKSYTTAVYGLIQPTGQSDGRATAIAVQDLHDFLNCLVNFCLPGYSFAL